MCTCQCTQVRARVNVHKYVHVSMYTSMCTCQCTQVCARVNVQKYVHVSMYISMYTSMCTCQCTQVCARVNVQVASRKFLLFVSLPLYMECLAVQTAEEPWYMEKNTILTFKTPTNLANSNYI